ncbi:MAG TPA: chemotaxis protein CheB [Terriglobales bacterium]|nr:chemotaxis protein CheB [Terriglobales bacterium]
MDEIVNDFLVESNENLDRLDQELVRLESEPSSKELLASIFRTIHTIKGSCGFLGPCGRESLFRSVATVCSAKALGIILTGMGQDGVKGCEVLRQAGARIIAQDEPSSVVWGMPGLVARAGLAHKILPLDQIGCEIVRATTLSLRAHG